METGEAIHTVAMTEQKAFHWRSQRSSLFQTVAQIEQKMNGCSQHP
jgi:hypothetical protein